MTKWIHKLINPHCIHCEKEENKYHDLLMTLLESEKRHTENIIRAFTTSDEKQDDTKVAKEFKPMGGVKLWDDQRRILEMAVHKRLLEENERANEVITKKVLTTEDLEEELLTEAEK